MSQQPSGSSSSSNTNNNNNNNANGNFPAPTSPQGPSAMSPSATPSNPSANTNNQSSSSSSNRQSSSSHASSSAAARQQRALFKPFLHTMRGILKVQQQQITQSQQQGQPPPNFHHHQQVPQGQLIINAEATPNERETGRLSRSGRQLSEMEILQEKHEPEFRRLMPVVASALKDVVSIHEPLRQFAPPDDRYSYYETNAPPGISIDAYVQRIAEYTYISPSTLLSSLIILDRLAGRHPTLLFTTLNIYKLFFVAVRISSKVVDLRTLNNRNFAPVGGISNRHLNDIEARMLIDLRFDLYISPQDFKTYVKRATDGEPQPIAISSSFQRAMTQMQQAQQRLDQQQRQQQQQQAASQNNNNNTNGGVPHSQSMGMDNMGAGGGDQQPADPNEPRLPPNRNALNPDGQAAPSLQL